MSLEINVGDIYYAPKHFWGVDSINLKIRIVKITRNYVFYEYLNDVPSIYIGRQFNRPIIAFITAVSLVNKTRINVAQFSEQFSVLIDMLKNT